MIQRMQRNEQEDADPITNRQFFIRTLELKATVRKTSNERLKTLQSTRQCQTIASRRQDAYRKAGIDGFFTQASKG